MPNAVRVLASLAVPLLAAAPLAAQQSTGPGGVAKSAEPITYVGPGARFARLKMGLLTTTGSVVVGSAGALVGGLSDLGTGGRDTCGSPLIVIPNFSAECNNHGKRLGIGYYGGTFLGATVAAYGASGRLEGCRTQSRGMRLARAAGGALLGASPGLIYLARGGHGYSTTGATRAAITPLTQGLASALLLRTCASGQ
jgi:hypothetical protein